MTILLARPERRGDPLEREMSRERRKKEIHASKGKIQACKQRTTAYWQPYSCELLRIFKREGDTSAQLLRAPQGT